MYTNAFKGGVAVRWGSLYVESMCTCTSIRTLVSAGRMVWVASNAGLGLEFEANGVGRC